MKKGRKYIVSESIDDKTEEILSCVKGSSSLSQSVRVCAAFWDKHHNKKSAPQVDDESETPGFLDD